MKTPQQEQPNPAPTPDPLWKTGEALAEKVKAGLSSLAPTPNVLATLRTITVFDSNGQPYEADLVPGDEHRAALAAKDAEIEALKRCIQNAHDAIDSSAIIMPREKSHQGLTPRVKSVIARAEKAEAERDALKMSEEESCEVISDLRAEADQLRAEVERLKAELQYGTTTGEPCAEITQLRAGLESAQAALAAAQEDAERLDWLETQDVWIGIRGEYEVVPDYACGGGYTMKVRAAIDAARKCQP